MSCGTCGSTLPPGTGSGAATGNPVHPCPHVCVSSIVILDNNNSAGSNVRQWVNLPRDVGFVDNDVITNTDRQTNRIRFRVFHDAPGNASVEVRLVPSSQAVRDRYSRSEKIRNHNYEFTGDWQSFSRNGSTGFTEGEVNVHVAGGDQFTIEARCTQANCHHMVRCNHTIEVWRRIWFIPIVMAGVRSRLPNLHSLRQEFELHKLRISERGTVEMAAVPTVSARGSKQELLNNAYSAYRNAGAPGLEPHIVAVLFIDQIASKRELPLQISNFGRGTINLTVQDASSQTFALWRNMGPGQNWFISGLFTPNNDVWGAPIEINPNSLTTVATGRNPEDHRQININADRAVFSVLESRFGRASVPDRAPGILDLRLNVVDHFTNGFAITHPNCRVNVVVIATRVRWTARQGNQMIATIVHELGHKIGMTPNGDPTTNSTSDLDRIATWYNQRHHAGPHCHQGINSPLPEDMRGQPGTCVMYGENGAQRGNGFCPNCSNAVRKVDISNGFVAFEPGLWAYLCAIF